MPVSTLRMRVHKYIPERLYGFVQDEAGRQVFFHLGSFMSGQAPGMEMACASCTTSGCTWAEMPAPPILGEEVDVDVDFEDSLDERAPRAVRVLRVNTPTPLRGVVEIFDPLRGFGFIRTPSGESYHLHKSEVIEGRLPVVGRRVSFYGGLRQGKPRACHVKVCS